MKTKSTGTAYILLILAGVFGVHRFYLGKTFTGILFLLTFGFAGFGVLLDLLLIPAIVNTHNAKITGTTEVSLEEQMKNLTNKMEEAGENFNKNIEEKTKKMEAWTKNKEAKNKAEWNAKSTKLTITAILILIPVSFIIAAIATI